MRAARNRTIAESTLGLALGVAVCLALTGCDHSDQLVFVDDTAPAVPGGVTTITGDREVEVLWNPVRGNRVEGYGVYRSTTLAGPYHRIATVKGEESSSYLDTGLANGSTYYYAVDAFDAQGHESDLSYEDAFDTPRPAGRNVQVFASQNNSSAAGLDLSDWARPSLFVTSSSAPDADIFFQRIGGVLYAKGTVISGQPNDIQDLGYTDSMDEIGWAPGQGWSVSPNGVELIEGHTYVVWTWELFYAKFRVVDILVDGGSPSGARIDWAYQVDNNNPELSPLFISLGERPVDEGRDS